MTMDCFKCNGYLHVTLDDDDELITIIQITHHQYHNPYINISIPEEVAEVVKNMKDLPVAKVSPNFYAFNDSLFYTIVLIRSGNTSSEIIQRWN